MSYLKGNVTENVIYVSYTFFHIAWKHGYVYLFLVNSYLSTCHTFEMTFTTYKYHEKVLLVLPLTPTSCNKAFSLRTSELPFLIN